LPEEAVASDTPVSENDLVFFRMQYDDDALKMVRYEWQKKADDFTSAYHRLWKAPKKLKKAGKTAFLVGDSIFQRFALTRFDRVVAEDPGPLVHVDRTFNFIAAASAIPYATTLRRRIIDFAAKIVRHGGRLVLKITAATCEQLDFFLLWKKSSSPPRYCWG
jgi:hypothetical protein